MIYKIGLAGLKFNGKDTCAGIIQAINPKIEILHYADYLKESVSQIFCVNLDNINDPSKKELPFIFGPIFIDQYLEEMKEVYRLNILPRIKFAHNIRELLQYVGTDYVRSVSPNYWIDHLDLSGKYWAASDIRFPNELKKVEDNGGITIWVNRINYPNKSDGHASENSISAEDCGIEIGIKENDFRIVKMLAKTLRYARVGDHYKYSYNYIKYVLDYELNIQQSCNFLSCQPEFVKFVREYYAK